MKTKYYTLLMALVYTVLGVYGPSALLAQMVDLNQKPWLRGEFPKVPGDQIYQYQIGRGEGDSYTYAQEQAIMDYLTSLPSLKQVNSTCQNFLLNHLQNGQTSGETKFECQDEVIQKLKSLSAKIDENYSRSSTGRHQVQVLVAFQDPDDLRSARFDPVVPHYTNTYGWSAGWRSLIVPGWGQFHKKTNIKGIIFLGGVLAGGSASLYFESKRSDNFRKSQETSNITLIREYRNRADDSELFRNIGITATAGLWVWAVIDAMNTKGALKYDYSKTARLYASRDGVTLGIRF